MYSDTIDDSVTGSFQQFDFNRWLEEVAQGVESILYEILAKIAVKLNGAGKKSCYFKSTMIEMFKLWMEYVRKVDMIEGESF